MNLFVHVKALDQGLSNVVDVSFAPRPPHVAPWFCDENMACRHARRHSHISVLGLRAPRKPAQSVGTAHSTPCARPLPRQGSLSIVAAAREAAARWVASRQYTGSSGGHGAQLGQPSPSGAQGARCGRARTVRRRVATHVPRGAVRHQSPCRTHRPSPAAAEPLCRYTTGAKRVGAQG